MSNKYIPKWYGSKRFSQYVLLLGLAVGFVPMEELQASPSVQTVAQQVNKRERNCT